MPDNVSIIVTGVKEAMAVCDPDKVRRAANQALNRVAISARKEASDIIRKEYNIKANRLAEYLRLSVRARGDNMEAVITGRGLGLALAYFDAKQAGVKLINAGAGKMRTKFLGATKRKKPNRGPVFIPGVGWKTVSFGGETTAITKISAGRKLVKSKYDHKPFMAQMKSGHIGVFERTGFENKIKERFGPGVGGLFGSSKIMQAVKKLVEDRFKGEFDHQLEHYLGLK
jgi:hypothetical protein